MFHQSTVLLTSLSVLDFTLHCKYWFILIPATSILVLAGAVPFMMMEREQSRHAVNKEITGLVSNSTIRTK